MSPILWMPKGRVDGIPRPVRKVHIGIGFGRCLALSKGEGGTDLSHRPFFLHMVV